MSDFDKYLGRPYVEGLVDCYDICRDYFEQEWDILLPNLARPTEFWNDPNLDLYALYKDYGFKPVFDENPQIGDVFLLPIMTSINVHALVYVDDNQILHHMTGRLSTLEPFRPRWSSRVTVHLRHPKVTQPIPEKVHLHEVLNADVLRNPKIQKEIEKEMEAGR